MTKTISDDDRNKVLDRLRRGLSYRQAAGTICSIRTAQVWAAQAGIDKPSVRSMTVSSWGQGNKYLKAIAVMHRRGISVAEIAKTFRISEASAQARIDYAVRGGL